MMLITSPKVFDLEPHHISMAMPFLRVADQCEWLVALGTDVASALLRYGWKNGKVAIAPNGKVLCMWGVEDDGYVWLAATVHAERSILSLHRILTEEVGKLHAKAGDLYCYADSRNTVHHRWLEWCGFEFVEEKPWGLLGFPFKHYRKAHNVRTDSNLNSGGPGLIGYGVLGCV